MQKVIWPFGIVAGLGSAFIEYLYFSNPNALPQQMGQYTILKIFVLLICLIFGLILIKKLNGNTISISRTLFSGVLMSVIRAFVMVLCFWYLYQPEGDFYKEKLNLAYRVATDKHQADTSITEEIRYERIEQAYEQIEFQYKPNGYAKIALLSSLASGFIISILMAAFIAKNQMYEK